MSIKENLANLPIECAEQSEAHLCPRGYQSRTISSGAQVGFVPQHILQVSYNQWKNVELGTLVEKITKGSTPTSYGYTYKSHGVKFIKTESINSFGFATNITSYIDEETNDFLARSKLKENDLLFSIAGTIGRVGIIRDIDLPANTNQALAIIRVLDNSIDVKYLFYYLNSPAIQNVATNSIVGVGRANVSLKNISDFIVPVPPIDQQKYIVAKIEELFSHIDAGIAALQKAKQLLKQYRQSVLKAAVTGELTREWREQNRDDAHGNANVAEGRTPGAAQLEPASELLKRILAERRNKWEQQHLEQFKAQGKVPKDEKWKEKYVEPEAPVIQDVPNLASEWQYVRLDTLTEIQGGLTVDSKRSSEDTERLPYLRVANVQRGFLDLSEIKEINVPKDRVESLSLKDRDILFNEGGDRDKLGRGWVWHEEVKSCTYQNHVFRARPYSSWIVSEFISIFGNTFGQEYFIRQGKQTTNLASINKSKLSAFPVPLCSEIEMKMAISLVDEKLLIIDRTAKNIDLQLVAAEKNKQSILAAAFSGKLQ